MAAAGSRGFKNDNTSPGEGRGLAHSLAIQLLPDQAAVLCDGLQVKIRKIEIYLDGKFMKISPVERSIINIGILEEDPLRLVGFQSILDQVPDIHVTAMSVAELASYAHLQIALLGNHSRKFLETMDTLRTVLPAVRLIVTGRAMDDDAILKALAGGAKGYVNEAAPTSELVQIIQTVHRGSVWVPRRVMSLFIERTLDSTRRRTQFGSVTFTTREKEVLEMLITGRSNKEIGAPLGIEERTVKAHVSKLMRKVGVTNRIALTLHAVSHELVAAH
jgi:DNA-binding NarL/FixJ family response regulator